MAVGDHIAQCFCSFPIKAGKQNRLSFRMPYSMYQSLSSTLRQNGALEQLKEGRVNIGSQSDDTVCPRGREHGEGPGEEA